MATRATGTTEAAMVEARQHPHGGLMAAVAGFGDWHVVGRRPRRPDDARPASMATGTIAWSPAHHTAHVTAFAARILMRTNQREAGCEMVEVLSSWRSEEHTSELQSLMRISSDVFCLKKTKYQP